jgi:hypothetical protein
MTDRRAGEFHPIKRDNNDQRMESPDAESFRSTSIWQFFGWSFLLSWLIRIPLTLAHFNLGPVRVSEQVRGLVRLLGVLMLGKSLIFK